MTHGLIGTYVNHRCRCEPCAAVWKAYQKSYAKRRGQRKGLCYTCSAPSGIYKRCLAHRIMEADRCKVRRQALKATAA